MYITEAIGNQLYIHTGRESLFDGVSRVGNVAEGVPRHRQELAHATDHCESFFVPYYSREESENKEG